MALIQELAHIIIITKATMSDYDSSVPDSESENEIEHEKAPFLYDYYLTNSVEVFQDWKDTEIKCKDLGQRHSLMKYLELEFAGVRKIQKYRTADIIRAKAFIHILKQAFEDTANRFTQAFESSTHPVEEPNTSLMAQKVRHLQRQLQQLIQYLEGVVEHQTQDYYNAGDRKFQAQVFDIISKLYSYVTDIRQLWRIAGTQILLDQDLTRHPISLGGSQSYYKNILRSMLKRNWHLKELYDRFTTELQKEQNKNHQESDFLVKMVYQVMQIHKKGKVSQKQRTEFIDIMKGLYFLHIGLRQQSLEYEFLLISAHLEVLSSQKMFKDYEHLQLLCIDLLSKLKQDPSILPAICSLQIGKLPFDKRTRTPKIEQVILQITYNYIAVAKNVLEEEKVFSHVKQIGYEKGFESTKELLKGNNFGKLVNLLMGIQQNSKDAFSQGDIHVHRVYLEMSQVLKEIYVSYQHETWLFPSNILLHIPLGYFIDISDDIKADIKKTLFLMVEAINQDRMPYKIVQNEGKLSKVRVPRSQYLQVILIFLEECHTEEQYINLPQILPTNLQTSILYVKSLEAKLNEKEPTPDQMPYVVNILKTCEKYKLNIKFKWYHQAQSIEDRQIQFNIEKGLPSDWMRKIYRQTINIREAVQIKNHFDKYMNHKDLTIINLANIFKYCHGLDPGSQIPKKSIKEIDLFTLLQEIKMLLSINFDIFNLNLDQQISLNYIHVCLSLYNSYYEQTPFNEAYMMIMESIMKPFLREKNSSLTSFKNKYPGFFNKWLYSFQIAVVFQQLGNYISESWQDDACREDIINKIKLVRLLIDNKENIKTTMKVQDLTQTIVLFSTLISRQAHPSVYIESVELFCSFLNTFPEVSKEASLQFMLDSSIMQDQLMASQMLKHVKKLEKDTYQRDQISIINHLIKNLPTFIDQIGLKHANELIDVYANRLGNGFDDALSQFQEIIFTTQSASFEVSVIRFVMMLKRQSQAEKMNKDKVDIIHKVKIIEESLLKLEKEKIKIDKGEIQFCELVFIQDVVNKLDTHRSDNRRPGNQLARNVFHSLIKKYGTNDDIIYFAEKLDFFDLILIGKKDQFDPRQETILLDLLIQTKYKGNETELIKKILRQSRKLSNVSSKAIDILSKEKDKIHAHHINKFIHINNRYPQEKIEQFIIQNIGFQRNHASVKIKQTYLIKDLVKKLEKIPKNVCEELLLRPLRGQQQQKLIDFISNIFEKLLYLPVSIFENISLKRVDEIPEEVQDWNTESEGQEQTKQQSSNMPKKKQEVGFGSDGSDDDAVNVPLQALQQALDAANESLQDQQDGQDFDQSAIVKMFTCEQKEGQMQLYRQLMILREQLDVFIDTDYSKLAPGSQLLSSPQFKKEMVPKLQKMVKLLQGINGQMSRQICARMPEELYNILRSHGCAIRIDEPELVEKLQHMRKKVTKPPKWLLQLFSDRQESDDSNIDEEDDENASVIFQDDYDEEQGVYDLDQMSDFDSDSDQQLPQVVIKPQKKSSSSQEKPKMKKKQSNQELPGLLPTYSKVEQQISGSELKREELIKILEISLYWLLNLPQSQIRTKQISTYYLEILQSNLGQIFFESFMTVIRYDETENNLDVYLRQLKQGKQGPKVEIGLQSISSQQSILNILYLLKEYQQWCSQKQSPPSNIIFKQSSCLLPIAEHMITRFDLPIQNNCLTLLHLYIATNKAKIRNKIVALDYQLQGGELEQGKKEYKLKQSEVKRVIEKVCRYGSSHHIWEVIEDTMHLKVNNINKLFNCIKGYGNHLHRHLCQTGEKIIKTIQEAQKVSKMNEGERPHKIQNTHHIVSKLIAAVKEEIKQFYFINKENLKQIMQEENDDLYAQVESVKKVPKKLLQKQDRIFRSRQLIKLTEAVMYFVRILKEQFYGKIEDKLFSKLVHYPKMIIEAVWYYIFIFNRYQKYKWQPPSSIAAFFAQNPFIGSYKFEHLQEVFGCVVFFFDLEPFCTAKFKQFFLPILMKNHSLSRQIPLQFKVPKTGEDQEYMTQSITVTRKCSFDMAFYQLVGHAIQVEFYNQEGSDQGGLVRQLMIGWKGRGVGQEAFFIGKILGVSFRQGVPYGGTIDIAMLVAITNYKPTIQFFKQTDPELYRSLKYIQQNDPQPLSLKFAFQAFKDDKHCSYELCENGHNIDLVEANKQKYLELYCQKYYYHGREKELQQLKQGFNSVVFADYAQIFTPLQMMRQIKGEEIVDVKMLISKAKYEGYSAESAVIRWFWAIVQTFDQETMNTFIQFVTGSPKITVYNSSFSITIQKVYDIECLPVAHTCFNTIDLPEYSSQEVLQRKLKTAIFEGNNSFGIL